MGALRSLEMVVMTRLQTITWATGKSYRGFTGLAQYGHCHPPSRSKILKKRHVLLRAGIVYRLQCDAGTDV